MRFWLPFAVALSTCCQPVKLHFVASELANLTFQLDAMAALSQADGAAYRALWRRELRWDREDDYQLHRWRTYRQQGQPAPSQPEVIDWPPNYAAFYGQELARDGHIRVAGLAARNVDDYRRRIRRLAGAPEANGLVSVIRHFQPRFSEFWARQARAQLTAKAERFQALVKERRIEHLAAQLAAFTEARLDRKREVWFYLITHPTRYGGQTMATMVGNHAPVELLDAERPEERRGVIVHELTHYFYDTAPRHRHLALIAAFRAEGGGWRMPAYSYLNEALATAAQGIAEGHAAEYAQPWIEELGAATKPVLERCLEANECGLFTGFTRRYLEAAESALGERTGDPHFRLASRVVWMGDDRLRAAARRFREGVPSITHVTGWEGVERFPGVPVVILAITGTEAAMRARLGPNREVVVITAPTPEGVEAEVEHFVAH